VSRSTIFLLAILNPTTELIYDMLRVRNIVLIFKLVIVIQFKSTKSEGEKRSAYILCRFGGTHPPEFKPIGFKRLLNTIPQSQQNKLDPCIESFFFMETLPPEIFNLLSRGKLRRLGGPTATFSKMRSYLKPNLHHCQ